MIYCCLLAVLCHRIYLRACKSIFKWSRDADISGVRFENQIARENQDQFDETEELYKQFNLFDHAQVLEDKSNERIKDEVVGLILDESKTQTPKMKVLFASSNSFEVHEPQEFSLDPKENLDQHDKTELCKQISLFDKSQGELVSLRGISSGSDKDEIIGHTLFESKTPKKKMKRLFTSNNRFELFEPVEFTFDQTSPHSIVTKQLLSKTKSASFLDRHK